MPWGNGNSGSGGRSATETARELIVLGIRGVPAAHGGFETFAEQLAPYLVERGWNVTVYCQEDGGERFDDEWNGVKRIHIPVSRSGSWGTIEFDVKCIADLKARPGMILTLGYNTGFLSKWLQLSGRRNVINMDGLEWKRAKYSFGPRAYLWVNERLAAGAGTRLIADHPVIADHLATRANRSKIDVISYGSDEVTTADVSLLRPFGVEPDRFFTVIARPEPENTILEVVQAFSERPRGMKLVVLGKYSRDHAYQRRVLEAAGSEVLFPGAIYDKPTMSALRLYSNAYIHGHRVGGTNPSLVEALGAGNAVIAHDNPFNRWVAGEAGAYFSDGATCAQQIDRLIADPQQRNRQRIAARTRWRAEFTWPKVLGQYEAVLGAV